MIKDPGLAMKHAVASGGEVIIPRLENPITIVDPTHDIAHDEQLLYGSLHVSHQS
jgi:hypothetical protein